MGAVQFIENLDRTALTISDDEFERHVEASVAVIAERQTSHNPGEAQGPLLNTGDRSTLRTVSHSPSRLPRSDGNGAVQGLIRNIQRPLSNIGRMFSDEHSTEGPAANQSDTQVVPNTDQHVENELAQTAVFLNEDDPANSHDVRPSQDVDVGHIVE